MVCFVDILVSQRLGNRLTLSGESICIDPTLAVWSLCVML